MIKNNIKYMSLILSALLISCSNPVTNNPLVSLQSNSHNNTSVGRVTISINKLSLKSENFKLKSVNFQDSSINKLRLDILGLNMQTVSSHPVSWIFGQEVNLNVQVPIGKNRIIRLVALDKDNNEISELMGALNVNSGDNKAKISFFDTMIAQILLHLLNNNSPFLNTLNLDSLKNSLILSTGYQESNLTFSKKNPSNIDSIEIANFILNNNGNTDIPESYIHESYGKVKVNSNLSGLKIMLTDLSSEAMSNTDSNSKLIEKVSTGRWKLIIMKDGYKTLSENIFVESDKTKEINVSLVVNNQQNSFPIKEINVKVTAFDQTNINLSDVTVSSLFSDNILDKTGKVKLEVGQKSNEQILFLSNSNDQTIAIAYIKGTNTITDGIDLDIQSIADGIIMANVFVFGYTSDERARILEECKKYNEYQQLKSEINKDIKINPTALLDDSLFPDIYRISSQLVTKVIQDSNTNKLSISNFNIKDASGGSSGGGVGSSNNIIGNISSPYLKDAYGNLVDFVNPTLLFYGTEIDNQAKFVVPGKERKFTIFSANNDETLPGKITYDLPEGNHNITYYRGHYNGTKIVERMAFTANMLKIADMTLDFFNPLVIDYTPIDNKGIANLAEKLVINNDIDIEELRVAAFTKFTSIQEDLKGIIDFLAEKTSKNKSETYLNRLIKKLRPDIDLRKNPVSKNFQGLKRVVSVVSKYLKFVDVSEVSIPYTYDLYKQPYSIPFCVSNNGGELLEDCDPLVKANKLVEKGKQKITQANNFMPAVPDYLSAIEKYNEAIPFYQDKIDKILNIPPYNRAVDKEYELFGAYSTLYSIYESKSSLSYIIGDAYLSNNIEAEEIYKSGIISSEKTLEPINKLLNETNSARIYYKDVTNNNSFDAWDSSSNLHKGLAYDNLVYGNFALGYLYNFKKNNKALSISTYLKVDNLISNAYDNYNKAKLFYLKDTLSSSPCDLIFVNNRFLILSRLKQGTLINLGKYLYNPINNSDNTINNISKAITSLKDHITEFDKFHRQYVDYKKFYDSNKANCSYEFYNYSLIIADEIGISDSYTELGNLYLFKKDYSEAIDNYSKSITQYQNIQEEYKNNYENEIKIVKRKIANVYSEKSQVFQDQGNASLDNARRFVQSYNDNKNLAIYYQSSNPGFSSVYAQLAARDLVQAKLLSGEAISSYNKSITELKNAIDAYSTDQNFYNGKIISINGYIIQANEILKI